MTATFFPFERGFVEFWNPAQLFRHVNNGGLDAGDVDRAVEFFAGAGCHAECVRTDQTANSSQWVGVHDLAS